MLCRGILKRHAARMCVIFFCAFAAIFAYVGIFSARDTVSASMEDFDSLWNGSVLTVESETLPAGSLREIISAENGVSEVFESCTYTVKCVCADGETRTVRFFGYPSEGGISCVKEGSGEFALSFGYASDFDSEAVSSLTLPNGRKVSLSATAYMPNHTSVYTDRYNVSTDGRVVDVITDIESLWELSGEEKVDGAAVKLDEGASVRDVKDALSVADHVKHVTLTSELPGYASTVTLGETVLKVCLVFPWILLLTGIVFIGVFLSGVIERSRGSVVVMLSDGASRGEVFLGFFTSALVPLTAALICALPASGALSDAISRTALENMGLPYSAPAFPVNHVAFCLFFCPAIAAVATMTGLLPLKGTDVHHFKRKIKRRRASMISDVLTVAFCSAAAMMLVIITCMYRDSQSEVKRELFSDRYSYDLQVIYSDFVPSSDVSFIKERDGVTAVYPAVIGTATLEFEGKTYSASGVGISEDAGMLIFRDEDGRRIKPSANSVVLSAGAASALGAEKGDVVSAQIHAGGKKIRVMCAVSEVSRQNSAYTELFSIDTVEEYLDSSGVMNCAFVKCDGNAVETAHKLSSLDGVFAVQTLSGAEARFDSRYSGTDKLISLIIADGIMLSLFIFLLMGYRTWKRNLRRNRILVMLGESPVRLALRDGAGRLTGAVMGLFAGYALSYPAGRYILEILSTDSITFPFVMKWETVLFAAGLTLFFALAGILFYASPSLRRRA